MKIIYLAQAFELENEYDSDRHYFHCKKMKESGHKLIVITSNIHYKTSTPKYKTKRFRSVKICSQGMDIYYVYSPKNFTGNYIKRSFYYLTYFVFSLPILKKQKKADIVFAVTPSITVALLGSLISKRLKAKLYLEVADVWPDVLIEMGHLKNKLIISLLRKLELFSYKRAHRIVAVTRGIMDNVQRKIKDKNKVFLVSNGVNRHLFPLNKEIVGEANQLRKKLNIENKFVCLYLGAHGLYNALETIVETANLLKTIPEIVFIFIGSGDKKKQLQKMTEDYHLKNIVFLSPVPRKKVSVWLQIADLCLLPNLKGDFYKMNLQNKFFDYLASSKPIVFAGAGETAEVLSKTKSGKVIEAENSKEMKNAIMELKSLTEIERTRMGANGRNYVLNHYDRDKISDKLIDLIENRKN